ncbi:MAG: helix-turn-helix transcriptional regulator [Clostridiales bacterium]|jgi:DNA-binding Xre family transcriptional regulator|nr:helix-turn-helix transcriptional regulator [Clostridiales bacterium]
MPEKSISYNKLWKLLIDKGMNKGDLKRLSGISTTSIAKMAKGQNLQLDVLLKVCKVLNCKVEEIIETVDIDLRDPKQHNQNIERSQNWGDKH